MSRSYENHLYEMNAHLESRKRVEEMSLVEFLELVDLADFKIRIGAAEWDGNKVPGVRARQEILQEWIRKLRLEVNK